jgi:hypothetical protein
MAVALDGTLIDPGPLAVIIRRDDFVRLVDVPEVAEKLGTNVCVYFVVATSDPDEEKTGRGCLMYFSVEDKLDNEVIDEIIPYNKFKLADSDDNVVIVGDNFCTLLKNATE